MEISFSDKHRRNISINFRNLSKRSVSLEFSIVEFLQSFLAQLLKVGF